MREPGVVEPGWGSSARRYRVSGRVQGVGYRMYAARTASSLGLKGGASNLDDGRVEILAWGPEHALERLEAALAEGPRLARVDHVEKETMDSSAISADACDVEF